MEWDISKCWIHGFRIEMDRFFLNSTNFEEIWTTGRGYWRKKFAFTFLPHFIDEDSFLGILKGNLNSEFPEDPVPEGYEKKFFQQPLNISQKNGKEILMELRNEIEKEKGVRIEKIFITFEKRNLSIKNSKGMNVEGSTEGIIIGGEIIVEMENDQQINYDFFYFNELDFDLKKLSGFLVEPAKALLKSEKPPTGIFRGILINRVMCEFFDAFIQSFTAEALFKNRTLLKGKEGEKIFSDILTVEENNPSFREPFYMPFDGEGVKKERSFIIKNGVFEDFLYNTALGRLYGKKPQGSSKSSPPSPPALTGSSILIRGDTSLQNLSERLEEGCIITTIIGGHTVNPVTGEISVGASGIFIKNGERKPFTGGIISGNFFDMLNKIEAIGNDFRTIKEITSPSILISEINLGG